MPVRQPRQSLEACVAEHLELPAHHCPSRRIGHLPQLLVHGRQKAHVALRVAPLERPRRRSAAAVHNAPAVQVLAHQARQPRSRQPRHFRQVAPHQPLVTLAQPAVAEPAQGPTDELVGALATRSDEIHRFVAFHERPNLFQPHHSLGLHGHDHPPMIPTHAPSGSPLVGITRPPSGSCLVGQGRGWRASAEHGYPARRARHRGTVCKLRT